MKIVKIALLIGILALALLACGETTTTTSTASTTSAAQAPTATLKWVTVQTFTGNGAKKTAIFTAPGDWKIRYTCAQLNIGGTLADGYLSVTVKDNSGTYVDLAINATCKTAKSTGETEEHQGGQVYLDVLGSGDWTLQVQELQ